MISSEPSPLLQAAVYMSAVLGGYILATPPAELARAWQTVRAVVRPRGERD